MINGFGVLYRYSHPHKAGKYLYVGQGSKRDHEHRIGRSSFGRRFYKQFPGVELPQPEYWAVAVSNQVELNEEETIAMFENRTWYAYGGMNLSLPGSLDYFMMGKVGGRSGTFESKSIGATKRAVTLGPDGLAASNKKRAQTLGKEGLLEIGRKVVETKGRDAMSASAKKAAQTLGFEGLSARAQKVADNMTPEQLSAKSRKGVETLGPEGCRARSDKARATRLLRNNYKGGKRSSETKQRMSEAAKARWARSKAESLPAV